MSAEFLHMISLNDLYHQEMRNKFAMQIVFI